MSPLLYSLAVTAAMIVVKMVAKLVCRHLLSGEVRREPGFVAVFWVGILSVWILTAPWSPVESARSLVEPVLMIALGLLGVLDLVADGDAETLADQAGDVAVGGVVLLFIR